MFKYITETGPTIKLEEIRRRRFAFLDRSTQEASPVTKEDSAMLDALSKYYRPINKHWVEPSRRNKEIDALEAKLSVCEDKEEREKIEARIEELELGM